MNRKKLYDALSFVEKPSRYLGSEINSIKKDLSRSNLLFALAFPDLYEIGTSHFGMQILYNILNKHSKIAAERVFAPDLDMGSYLKSSKTPLCSLESQKPLSCFDIIGFSLLYELNYTNILYMLDLAHIPFFSKQREEKFPFIIAGGPCVFNPEPVADFFDAMVIGDGEEVIIKICDSLIEWGENGDKQKKKLLSTWSDIDGVYIPSLYKHEYNYSGFQTSEPVLSKTHHNPKKAVVKNLDNTQFPDKPIVPYGKPVHDRLRLELARGCSRGCRFCQAGMIYRPVRERSPEKLLALSDAAIASTGYDDISLLSLSTGDYSCITLLMVHLMAKFEPQKIAVSLPSLRAGTLTPELMEMVKRVRKTGFTIAPEAGSQRLRDVINKNISQTDIHKTVHDAFMLGWKTIKLYFMIGLPTETYKDLEEIISLVKSIRNINAKQGKKLGRRPQINVSISTFVPKPHTPFQWSSQISLSESKSRLEFLKKRLKLPGIKVKWQQPEVSFLEGLWSRGDRKLSALLVNAYNRGCKFDGWSDKFKYNLWEEALVESDINIDFYTTRQRTMDEPFPWDHIDSRIDRSFLKKEYKKALLCESTPDCRTTKCGMCGACDFNNIEPVLCSKTKDDEKTSFSSLKDACKPSVWPENKSFEKLKISYCKKDQAKFFGHLELASIFFRALKRAKISVKFSEGFHPKPKISFQDPLPVGIESENESLFITVLKQTNYDNIIYKLNNCLPSGLKVNSCKVFNSKTDKFLSKSVSYTVVLKSGFFDMNKLQSFSKKDSVVISHTNHKGKTKNIDLKKMIKKIYIVESEKLRMTIRKEPGKTLRPNNVIEHIFNLPDSTIRGAKIIKEN